MSAARPQLDALTGARGIAAWYVVLYHIRLSFSDSLPSGLMTFLGKGYLAVDIFFVLSGFVMWLTYGAKFTQDGLRAAPDFYVKRLARIYPLHFFVLAAVLAYVGLLWMTGRANPVRYPLAEFPLHLLLIQNWGMTPNLAWNDPDWSISTEMAAYLIFPIVAVALSRFKLPTPAIYVLLLAFAGLLDVYMVAHGAANIGFDITKTGLVRCLFEFFSGVLVCMIWRRNAPKPNPLVTVAIAGAGSILAVLWFAGLARETFVVPLIGSACVYCLARTSNGAGNPLSGRVLRYVGDISYSTYLIHYPLWTLFKLIFVRDVNHVAAPLMFLYLGATFILSALLYHMIEQPGRSWVQAIGQKTIGPRQRGGQPLLD
jgi:peptidoglycan/LPS O-acetylase OafA/YrhL